MMNAVRGELVRLTSTRLLLWAAAAAVLSGGGLTGLLALVGPENSTPPMPGIDTAEGVGVVLGLGGMLLFVPALIGTIAVTSEYRHRTVGTTFLVVPRRSRVLRAKLVVYGLLGAGYGLVSSVSSGAALVGAAAVRGVDPGASVSDIALLLTKLALAGAVHVLIGVAVGAVARHQLLAVGLVLGYFYLLEPVLMIVPGLGDVYPYLPGGATAALTDFTFLTDAAADRLPVGTATLLPPALAAVLLLGYAAAAAGAAVVAPLQRDLG